MLSPSRIQHKLFYGWVVVAAFLVISTVIYGSYNSFGVFFKSIESEFSLTRAATSMVFSVLMVLSSVFALLGGWALDRYGPRIIVLLMSLFAGLSLLLTSQTNALWQLFITYSLLLSMGTGAMYIMIMATVSRWFDKKRGLALGIAGMGSGLGVIAIAPFATYLISSFDWRMAYIIMGLIAWLVVIPLSRLLRKTPYEIGALPDGAKPGSGETRVPGPKKEGATQSTGFSLLEASRTLNFWLFGAIWLLFGFCFLLILTHIVPHVTDIGIPPMEAAAVLSLIGGSSIVGRLLMGRASDSIGRKATAITCAILMAGAMLWLIWSRELWMLYIFGAAFGFSRGGLDPPITALIGDAFGLRNIGVIMGAINVAWGIGAAAGPYVGGRVFDVFNNYSAAFMAGVLAMLMLAGLIALTKQETNTTT